MTEVFEKLRDPPGRYYFCYFSDDSCLSIRHGGRVYSYNLDISKCDASHSDTLFDALEEITPECGKEDMAVLTAQCGLPLEIRSTVNRKVKVILQARRRLLFSGSTITTGINNLANLLIGHAVSNCDFRGDPAAIIAAARLVGYVITLDDCQVPKDPNVLPGIHLLQFLKHSPVYDTQGILRPLLNPGVLLRLSGTCNGELPGSKNQPLRDRAIAMQDGLLRGAYPYAQFTLLDNLKKQCPHKTLSANHQKQIDRIVTGTLLYKITSLSEKVEKYPTFRVNSDAMWLRYGLTDSEIYEIEEMFGTMGPYMSLAGPGLDKVLKLDYGLTTVAF
jgi:hypothetical protein